MKSIKNSSVEFHRRYWKKVAKENGWDRDPFFVQIWIDKNGKVRDSVSTRVLDKDLFLDYDDDYLLSADDLKERNFKIR